MDSFDPLQNNQNSNSLDSVDSAKHSKGSRKMSDAGTVSVGNVTYDSNAILGHGSLGTTVYQGQF